MATAPLDPNAPPPRQRLAAMGAAPGTSASPTLPGNAAAGIRATYHTQPSPQQAATAALPPAATPAQTGVNPGGQGYNSGQVNPAQAAAAFSAPATGGSGPSITGTTVTPAGAALGIGRAPTGAATQIASAAPTALTGSLGTAPTSAPVAARAPSAGVAAAPSGAPGTTGANAGGTTNGYNPLTSGPLGASGIGGALNSLTGGLLQTQQADLSGVHAAQNADFGTAQNLSQERYDYTPGAAPSQTGAVINTADANQTRSAQQNALGALGAAASGAVPSAAELQLRQQAAKNNAATLGAARALGGRSAGGVARAATLAGAANNAATNATAGQQRAAEQATARQQQIEALSGVRNQDVATAQDQAALDQARNANNLQAQTTADAQAQAQRQALLQAQLQAMGYGSSAAGAGATASAANAAAQNAAKGGVLKTIGSAVGL